jgi:hypothetical protein
MRKLVAPAIGAIATVVLLTASAAEAKSEWADIRVVASDGAEFADIRQYTDHVKVQASEDADCFGESNPSTNNTYKLDDPTVLGTLIDTSKSHGLMTPLLITDAFFYEYGSFGVCGMGVYEGSDVFGEEYWYNAVNGIGAAAGPNQIPVENGDRQLWYFATGAETAIAELVLKAPVRVAPDEPFEVKVTRIKPNGTKEPAEGVSVNGDVGPTDENGQTEVVIESEGHSGLRATGDLDDVPSATLGVCASNDLSECPKRRGKEIFGSPSDDVIKATKGPDTISCGRGDDIVVEAQSADDIANSCEKVKNS